MASASASIDIPASADQVWQLIGGFDTLPDWLPFIPKSELSEGGRVRSLQTADGVAIVERLQHFDNHARAYSYSFIEKPFPVNDYLATLRVEALSDKSSRVVWSGSFTPVGISDEAAVELFSGIYSGGLEALRGNFPA